ncbi:MAG: glycoside hydrolase family 35 [Phycisphaerales bacterium]|nr:glycoside hydrolase family 35 [Phycisphaerales bacterium]
MSTIARSQLRRVGLRTQLHVDGKPFLALGGELGNSNASDLAVLATALDKCQRMNLNTIMLPLYWDLIEPREGEFDFLLVQGSIDLARARHLRLVPLWFGTWKNSMSCYAPSWVKRDTNRFPRVHRSSGELEEIISPQSAAANEADANAFARLMRFIRDYDAATGTVIMVQVENEVGMIPEARDHSEAAEAAYRSDVPETLLTLARNGELGPEVSALWEAAGRKTAGSWGEVFGTGPAGDEVFSAWQFATYVQKVTAAGKREYALPMFTNAALIRPGYQPGQYPSAGPLPHLLEIWRAGAPSLDMICPDIYFPNFIEWCDKYDRNGNPVFIPEMAATMRASANAVFAAARYGAIGCGPFSIENVEGEKQRLISDCYAALAGLSELILIGQQEGTILGLSPKVGFDWSVDESMQAGELGGITFKAVFDRQEIGGDTQTTTLPTLGAGRWDAPPGTPHGAAMILQQSPDAFIVLGMGVKITFAPADGQGKIGIDQVQEGRFTPGGVWRGGRFLNGDETHQGRHIHLPDVSWTVQRISLYRY